MVATIIILVTNIQIIATDMELEAMEAMGMVPMVIVMMIKVLKETLKIMFFLLERESGI